MNTPSMRDLELLSAYLDRELPQTEKTRLVARIVKEPALAQALEDLRQTRSMLRQTPRRKAPRNFTLTPKMLGIRPPTPRVVPALSWASAIAGLMFLFTIGFNFLTSSGGLSAAAPRAADQYGIAQAPAATQAPATQPPATLAPVSPYAIQAPTSTSPRPTNTINPLFQPKGTLPAQSTPTSRLSAIQGMGIQTPTETPTLEPTDTSTVTSTATSTVTSEPTLESVAGTGPSETHVDRAARQPLPWAYIWLGLAVLLVGTALLIRWLNRLAFERRMKR